jgi:hypothetical protein
MKEEIGYGIGTDEGHIAELMCAHGRPSSILSREVHMTSRNKAIFPINIDGINPSVYHKSWFCVLFSPGPWMTFQLAHL